MKAVAYANNSVVFLSWQYAKLDLSFVSELVKRYYATTLGLPVMNYRSVIEVTGDDVCRLTWTSTFTIDKKDEGFVDTLAHILAAGTNQIAATLHLG